MGEETLYEQLGGEAALRPIVDAFVREMVNDPMIGFFFEGVDTERLIELELQFTARFLGAKQPYEGRPMRAAHRRHPIMGGQFDRRRRILEQAIERHGVPENVRTAWLEHVDRLRPQITKDGSGECNTPDTAETAAPPALRILT